MTFNAHPIFDPQDRQPRPVASLLAPTLNRDGHDADNFELDTRTMLAGLSPSSTAITGFLQGCLSAAIEPDNFAPGGRVVSLSEADLARWQAIRAAFAATRIRVPHATLTLASN